MSTTSLDTVKSKVLELFSHMGIPVEIFERVEEGRTVLNLKTTDAQLLIGKQGANLEALQHIVRLLVRDESKLRFRLRSTSMITKKSARFI
jgi:predicted RNA-binding protein Jag